jgi:hypothetical protein
MRTLRCSSKHLDNGACAYLARAPLGADERIPAQKRS